MLRIILTRTNDSPSRQAITEHDRTIGDRWFNGLDAEYAGYIILEDTGCLSAQWIVNEPYDRFDVMRHLGSSPASENGYTIRVFQDIEDDNEELIIETKS